MSLLSPLDALGPAFRRTREVLSNPFRLGFFLKIALIGALTQPSFYSATFSYPIQGMQFAALQRAGHRGGSHLMGVPGLAAFGVVVLVGIAVFGVALWVLLSYLYCRLRFTLFDLVVSKRGQVGKAWSGYGRQSWRYFGLVMLVSLAFLLVSIVVIGPTVLNMVRAIKPLAASGPNVNPLAMLGAMFPMIAAVIFMGVLWAVVDSLMQDFLLPPMAIEDAPLEFAFGRFFALLRAEFGSVVIYVLLRFAIAIGLSWALMLVFAVVFLAAGLGIYGIGTLLYHALWATVVGQVICVALAILVGIVAIALYLAAIISIYGILAVFKQSYAAYFFGGRYAALGERLEPPAAVAVEDVVTTPLVASAPPELPALGDAPPVW